MTATRGEFSRPLMPGTPAAALMLRIWWATGPVFLTDEERPLLPDLLAAFIARGIPLTINTVDRGADRYDRVRELLGVDDPHASILGQPTTISGTVENLATVHIGPPLRDRRTPSVAVDDCGQEGLPTVVRMNGFDPANVPVDVILAGQDNS